MKDLLDSGFRLSSFVSDIFGVTGRGIILHLIIFSQQCTLDKKMISYGIIEKRHI